MEVVPAFVRVHLRPRRTGHRPDPILAIFGEKKHEKWTFLGGRARKRKMSTIGVTWDSEAECEAVDLDEGAGIAPIRS